MGPEILVVGDVAASQPMWHAIGDRGYEVVLCMEHELEGRLAQSPLPAAMVLSMDGTDYAAVLSQCRRHPEGASLPVVLFAHAQGPVGSLADLIELGADQVLYSPVDPKLLAQALLSLAGPGEDQEPPSRPARRPRSSTRSRRATPAPAVSGSGESGAEAKSPRPAFAESLPQHAPTKPEVAQAEVQFLSPEEDTPVSSDRMNESVDSQEQAVSLAFSDSSQELVEDPLNGISQDDEDHRALEALVAEERAIERDLAAFRIEDLPRIEDPSQGFDPQAAEAELFGATPASPPPRERTSTHHGGPVQNPPPAPSGEFEEYEDPESWKEPWQASSFDPGGRTAEIPHEEMPHQALPVPERTPRGELARLARRLEPRRESFGESAGNETIRIERSYGQPLLSTPEVTAVGPLNGQREGLLSQTEVPRLLWELSEARFSGVLDLVTAEDTLLRIAWQEGGVCTVKGSEQGDSLPASLWRRLLLTKEQYEELCSIPAHAQVPETMVAHLVRRGWLSDEEQAFALSRWIEDTVLRWWTVGSGRWKLTPDPEHWLCKEGRGRWDVASVFLSACIDQVTPALARMWMGERSYAPRLKELHREPGLSSEAWLAQRFGAPAMVRQWLAFADGRPIEELETALGWQQRYGVSSMGLCYALSVLSLIDLPELAAPQTARAHALLRERLSARLALAVSGSYFEFLGLSDQASSAQADLASQNLRDALARIEQDPAKLAPVEDLVLALKENLQAAQRVLGDADARAMYLRTRTEDAR